jgi:hypothetical protein
VVFVSKSILLIFEKGFARSLQTTAQFFFNPYIVITHKRLNKTPEFKLIVVMALIPLVLNALCVKFLFKISFGFRIASSRKALSGLMRRNL